MPAKTDPAEDPTGINTLVPMTHPDGGTCDAYPSEDGVMLVPALEVPAMLDHGFVVAAGDE